jgi:hypothetical protein
MDTELFYQIGAPEQWSSPIKAALGAERCTELSQAWDGLDAEIKAECRNAYVTASAEQRIKRLKAAKTTTIQTLIFSKDKFKTVAEAHKWISDHGFAETKEPDETETSFRFRQESPENFASGTMRTIDITDGVKAVIGRLKKNENKVHKEHVVAISKVDSENRIVYGVVLDPYIVDSQGDHMTPSDVEKTANDYMENYRNIGLFHAGKAPSCIPVQSWLVPYPSREDYALAMSDKPHRILMMPFGDSEIPSGCWVLGTKVNDDALWQKVQSEELNAYSIGGYGEREDMTASQMPVVTSRLKMSA